MRRLALFAYSFAAAALFCSLFLLWIPVFAVMGVLAAAAVISIVGSGNRLRWLRPIALGMAIGFLWCGWQNLNIDRKASQLCGESRYAEVCVLAYPLSTDYGASVDVRINGLRCRLYLDENPEAEPGDIFSLTAHFKKTMENTDNEYHISRGISVFGYADGQAVNTGRDPRVWKYWPAKIGNQMRNSIEQVCDSDTAAFLKAILTGDRHDLQENTYFYAMLKRSGVVHCIAISGMHLSFLVTFLYVLLGRGTAAAIVCIPVTLLFMAVTGFTPSVVRAGVMQLALSLSGLTRREYDGDTALGLSLLLLVAWNPYAILNAGLQLSFASTLGILHFSQPISAALPGFGKKLEKRKYIVSLSRYVRSSVAVSLSAMILTVPLTVLYFNQFSIVAPVTNLLILWAVSLCFSIGLITTLMGLFLPSAAAILAWPVRILVRYITVVAGMIGNLPFASFSPEAPMMGVGMLLSYLLLLYFRFRPGLSKRLQGFLVSSAVCMLVCILLNRGYYQTEALCTAALDVGQGQCIVITGKDYTLVADCGGSGSENAGDTAADYLLNCGRSKIDILLLTHLHQDHANGVIELLRRIPIRQLILPADDSQLGMEIMTAAETSGTSVAVISNVVEYWTLGELNLTIVPPLGETGDNEQGIILLCSRGDYEVLLTGDAGILTEQRLMERVSLPDIEVLVAGHHGSRNSVSEKLLRITAPDAVLLSVGRNSYGLPAEETLQRIAMSGAVLYRTDENGSVRITDQERKQKNE